MFVLHLHDRANPGQDFVFLFFPFSEAQVSQTVLWSNFAYHECFPAGELERAGTVGAAVEFLSVVKRLHAEQAGLGIYPSDEMVFLHFLYTYFACTA